MTRYSRAVGPVVRENAFKFTHILAIGIVWGSKHTFLGCYAVLLTKTSRWCIQFNGSPPSVSSACSQVFTTRLVNSSVCLTSITVTLLIVSLLLITRSHLSL